MFFIKAALYLCQLQRRAELDEFATRRGGWNSFLGPLLAVVALRVTAENVKHQMISDWQQRIHGGEAGRLRESETRVTT